MRQSKHAQNSPNTGIVESLYIPSSWRMNVPREFWVYLMIKHSAGFDKRIYDKISDIG